MDRVFFTNSGTEAIEGAIKAAKKYAYTRDGHAGHEIIAMNHSFHGRSIGALSVTGNKHYQERFKIWWVMKFILQNIQLLTHMNFKSFFHLW